MSVRGAALTSAMAIVVAFALAGCKKREPQESPVAPEPLPIEVSGCALLVRGACVLPDDGKIRVFVPLSKRGGDRIDVKFLRAPPIITNGGTLVSLAVPASEREVIVTRTSVDGSRALARLELTSSPRPGWFKNAQDLRQQGKLDEADALARPALTAESVGDRASAEGLLARIELRRGNLTEAERLFRSAIEHDASAGFDSERVDDALALVFMLHKRGRQYAEARKVLRELVPALERYPDGKAREPLYRAQVEWEVGDTRAAGSLLDEAIERANRIGATSIARAARQVRGMVACTAGTRSACLTALVEADRELEGTKDATACERAEVAISLGFAALEEFEVTHADPRVKGKAIGAEDERGLSLLDAGCPDKYMRAVAAEHLALAAIYKKDLETAKKRLAEAKEAAPEPRIPDAIFWLDVEARIAELEEKIDDALALQRRARLLAESSALRAQAWRATTAVGRLLEAKGAKYEAIDTYRAAEAIVDEIIALVPFGEGRAGAAKDSAESMQRLAALLLEQKRDKEALDVVRQARARLVRSLDVVSALLALPQSARESWDARVAEYRVARDKVDEEAASDWKLSEDALRLARTERAQKLIELRASLNGALDVLAVAPAASAPPNLPVQETTLAFAHVGKDRAAVGFVVEQGRVRSFPLGEVVVNASRPALAEKLLAPAAAELDRATRVRVLADDATFGVDVHALPFHEVPLVMRVPVVYGVDLDDRGKRRPEQEGDAIIVADPTGDLPSARAEGEKLGRAIPRSVVVTGREATATRVRAAIDGARLFHYAGHGSFKGRDGAESSLPLAQNSALTFGDILALPHAPTLVVLSGCETGRREGVDQEASASLAEAFLVAGSVIVVAPVRVIPDRDASEIAPVVDGDAESGDLAVQLARAQQAAIKRGGTGWEAFRAFVR